MVNDLEYKRELIGMFKNIYPTLINPFAITLTKPNTHLTHQTLIEDFMKLLNRSYLKSRNKRFKERF